jgi:two-component system osmolarity sensor histidine kinase EnvZ
MVTRWFLRRQRYLIPRSFWVRAIVLVVTPMVLVQFISGYVFFKHHLQTVTRESARALAGNIALATKLWETKVLNITPQEIERRLLQNLHLSIRPQFILPKQHPASYYFQSYLEQALKEKLTGLYWIHMRKRLTHVGIPFKDETLIFSFPTRLFFPRTTSKLWFLWSFGSALLFSLLALFFMRRQILPLQDLTRIARDVERGKRIAALRLRGPLEVRQVSKTLQNTYFKLQEKHAEHMHMLAALSHDLRTPLTRLRLQLSLMQKSSEVEGLQTDVEQMMQMVDSYLAFVQEGQTDIKEEINLTVFCEQFAKKQPKKPHLVLEINALKNQKVTLPVVTLTRCLQNLQDNAARHACSQIKLVVIQKANRVTFEVHDDGPGVDPQDYDKLTRPFMRLDESRNLEGGNVGLGLTVVQRLLHGVGGQLSFTKSPLGGLCARIVLRETEA